MDKHTKQVKSMDKRCVKTKKTIRNALIKLMLVKDVQSISITELSTEADINRKTFYMHYCAINDVIMEIEDGIISKLVSVIRQYDIFGNNAELSDLFQGINNIINNDFEFCRCLISVNQRAFFAERIRNSVKQAIIELAYGKVECDDEILSLTIDFMLCGLTSLYSNWFMSYPQMLSFDQLSSLATELTCNGVKNIIIKNK